MSTAGALKCWGRNVEGQIGDRTTTDRTTASDVHVDSDADGCSDIQEQGSAESSGGDRNHKLFWDFFDVPTTSSYMRDRAVVTPDISAVTARFGYSGSPSVDPLSVPPAPPYYHPAYDRTDDPSSSEAWDLLGPNGGITIQDISLVVAQFGHSCI
jgi:hypothetical protein